MSKDICEHYSKHVQHKSFFQMVFVLLINTDLVEVSVEFQNDPCSVLDIMYSKIQLRIKRRNNHAEPFTMVKHSLLHYHVYSWYGQKKPD